MKFAVHLLNKICLIDVLLDKQIFKYFIFSKSRSAKIICLLIMIIYCIQWPINFTRVSLMVRNVGILTHRYYFPAKYNEN